MRLSPTLPLIALLPGLLSGCALLKTLGIDLSASNKPLDSTDVQAARDAGNAELLGDICMQKVEVNGSVRLYEVCKLAADVYSERGDYDTLTNICEQKGAGEAYEAWFSRLEACQYARTAQGATEVKTLLAASCGDLEGSFKAASGALGGQLDRNQANEVFRKVSKKAVECDKVDWLIEEVAHWGSTEKDMGYAAIEAAADAGVQWEDTFLDYVGRHNGAPFSGLKGKAFLDHYMGYLVNHGMTDRCTDYIPVAQRVEDLSFGPLNWYFRETGCTAAVDTIGARLTAERHKTRQYACKSLAVLGGSKYKSKVQKLASSDPYYWLKEKDDRGRYYVQPIKVYDVRDECGAAALRL